MKLQLLTLLFLVLSSSIFAQKTEISIATAKGRMVTNLPTSGTRLTTKQQGTQISLYNKINKRVWAGAHFSYFAEQVDTYSPVRFWQVQLGQKLNLLPKSKYWSFFLESGVSFLYDKESTIIRPSFEMCCFGDCYFPYTSQTNRVFYPGGYARTDLQIHLLPRIFVGVGAGLTYMPLLKSQHANSLFASDLSMKLGARF